MSIAASLRNEIFIVDDDPTESEWLSMALSLEGHRVRIFRDGTAFTVAARIQPPACVLLSLRAPARSGLDILRTLNAKSCAAPILVVSDCGDIPTVVEAIKVGAFDFIERRLGSAAMATRVRGAMAHWDKQRQQDGTDGGLSSQSFPGRDRLTQRERDVLNQVVAGASNTEAAQSLGISRRTVEIHRLHIMRKLGARNSADLVRIVLSSGHRA